MCDALKSLQGDNEVIYLGNGTNRFFQYRMKYTVDLPVLLVEELKMQEPIMKLINDLSDMFQKTVNARFIYKEMAYEDLKGNNTIFKEMNDIGAILFLAELLDVFETNFWYYSAYFAISDMTLLTHPPKSVEKYSMAFLSMDDMVIFLTVTCILFLPLQTILTIHLEEKWTGLGRNITKSWKSRAREYSILCWDYMCIFFCEPFERVPKSVPSRILMASWLIFICFISIYMGSFFKTEVYSTEYVYIDNLESLSVDSDLKLAFLLNGIPHRYVKEWEQDILKKNSKLSLKERWHILDIYDILSPDHYMDIQREKYAYIVPQFVLENIFGYILEGDKTPIKLQYSRDVLKSVTFVVPIHQMFQKCPGVMEQINLVSMVFVETQLAQTFFMRNQFIGSKTQWKKPPLTVSGLDMKATRGAFLLYLYCMAITALFGLIEVLAFWH